MVYIGRSHHYVVQACIHLRMGKSTQWLQPTLCLYIVGPRLAGAGNNTEHRAHGMIGSRLDPASPTRGRIVAAFNCSLSAGRTLPSGR